MPCEGCNVQFTVFRRKRCCSDCKRFYCNNCLTSSPNRNTTAYLCDRCAVFAKRPLLKVDLLKLKPKDLIFYLQSKHISTAGCVEKDELVGLVLNHIHQLDQSHQNANGNDFNNGSNTRGFDSGHSFDALKQSCQNFFSNISDKVDSFSFEAKPAQTKAQTNRRSSSSNTATSNITEQPRYSTREIPSYASFQNRQPQTSVPMASARVEMRPQNSSQNERTQSSTDSDRVDSVSSRKVPLHPPASSFTGNENSTNNYLPPESSNITSGGRPGGRSAAQQENSSLSIPMNNSPSFTSQTNSPIISTESSSPTQYGTSGSSRNILDPEQDSVSLYTPTGTVDCMSGEDKEGNGSASGCECSDDEIITSFRTRTSMIGGGRLHSPQSSSSLENPVAGPSGSSNVLTSTSTATKKSSPSLKIESYDESSESSFEELGAIGGISDDSKTAADSSVPTSERWQFVEKETTATGETVETRNAAVGPLTVAVLSSEAVHTDYQPLPNIRPKKVTRRRSDGYLNRRRIRSDDDDSPTSPVGIKPLRDARSLREEDEADNEQDLEEGDEVQTMNDNRLNCKRCGKNRTNIKKHVERMRRHLQNSQMAETEIKQELEEFLVYLEKRTKSIDCSDSETTTIASGARESNCQMPSMSSTVSPPEFFNRDEMRSSIHVYATPSNSNTATTDSRFINLEDFNFLEELENLSVKQLKEILMLNRVDYKGCCEKQELLDRVVRLWKNLKSTPAVEKLPTDELCKICMDAPIECVILECGHMATCTNCGKVLSECPICRQYIVRVVRFFKA